MLVAFFEVQRGVPVAEGEHAVFLQVDVFLFFEVDLCHVEHDRVEVLDCLGGFREVDFFEVQLAPEVLDDLESAVFERGLAGGFDCFEPADAVEELVELFEDFVGEVEQGGREGELEEVERKWEYKLVSKKNAF